MATLRERAGQALRRFFPDTTTQGQIAQLTAQVSDLQLKKSTEDFARIAVDPYSAHQGGYAMKTLWFKSEFVDAIVRGVKTDTIRRSSTRLPRIGEIVRLTVGPRSPFAHVRVLTVTSVNADLLPAEKRHQIFACYARDSGPFVRITFELVPQPTREFSNRRSYEHSRAK